MPGRSAVPGRGNEAASTLSGAVTITLDVVGLDCAECARTVEKSVAEMVGVEAAKLTFATARLVARIDPERVAASDISSVLASAGYGTRTAGDRTGGDLRAFSSRLGPRALPVATAGLAILAGFIAVLIGAPTAVQAACFVLAVVLAGAPVARAAVLAVRAHRALDMNVLMLIAAVGALIVGEWAEGAMVVFLFCVGTLLEGYTTDRARTAIRQLMDLAPSTALVRQDGHERVVSADALEPGDLVVARPGERFPVDGIVIAGTSTANEAPLTGESRPVDKSAGDSVYAGTINGTGALDIRATRPASETTLARIIEMVESAQARRAPAQRYVDRFARAYTPIVIAVAAAVAALPPLILGAPIDAWLYRALVLLVIACPCALVIATPVSIVAAISAAARRGVLVKGGAYLEAAGGMRALAIDKTGTLTEGRPVVTDVLALGEMTESDVLALAAAAEMRSEHPLGRAIVHEARHRHLPIPAPAAFEALVGRGARARVGDAWVTVGPRDALDGVAHGAATRSALTVLEHAGKTAMLVARDGVAVGIVAVADRLRAESIDAIREAREAGIRHIVMLSGDNEATARAIGAEVGIDDVRASLLPGDKAGVVASLRRRHGVVGMVGDGVNDAPALAAASVGIAVSGNGMGGSDAALETADVVLMSADLTRVPYLVRLGRRTRRIVAANIAFSLLVKAAFLTLAVAGVATLWMAVLADVGTSLLVVLNAMRLLRPQREGGPGRRGPAWSS